MIFRCYKYKTQEIAQEYVLQHGSPISIFAPVLAYLERNSITFLSVSFLKTTDFVKRRTRVFFKITPRLRGTRTTLALLGFIAQVLQALVSKAICADTYALHSFLLLSRVMMTTKSYGWVLCNQGETINHPLATRFTRCDDCFDSTLLPCSTKPLNAIPRQSWRSSEIFVRKSFKNWRGF